MKVAMFFDGKNFYKGLRGYNPHLEIDYNKFAEWITSVAGGANSRFVGAYYYTGFSHNHSPAARAFANFLKGLEVQKGYFIKREPRVKRSAWCKICHKKYAYMAEKRVDTRLVAELIQFAAVDAFDIGVLASGDQDLIPAVEAASALGKQIFVATWPGQGLSKDLRACCFGQIGLEKGVSFFSTKKPPTAVKTEEMSPDELKKKVLEELDKAASVMPSYVSRWYFENEWQSLSGLLLIDDRKALIDEMITEGRIEQYSTVNNKGRDVIALRPIKET